MRHSVAFSGFGTAMPERNATIPFWENSLAKPWRTPSFIQHVVPGGDVPHCLSFPVMCRDLFPISRLRT